jgi:hypothetical protein
VPAAPKIFLGLLDGRTTWQVCGELERHVTRCWHCIDHFCRLVEVVELLRGNKPLSDAEAAPSRELQGVSAVKTPLWKRWLAGRRNGNSRAGTGKRAGGSGGSPVSVSQSD